MSERKIPLRLLRFQKFILTLLKNKMAFVGFVLLVTAVVFAVGAPLFTPYSPQSSNVGSRLAQPSWVPIFFGEVGFSQNAEFTGLAARPEGGVVAANTFTGPSSVDLQVGSTASEGRILIQKTLQWPYRASAARFFGGVIINAPSDIGSAGVNATLYLERYTSAGVPDARWFFWNTTLNAGENKPFPSVDSVSGALAQRMGLGNTNVAAQIIFSKVAQFGYSLELEFPAGFTGASLTVSAFNLSLHGNTWGLLGTDPSGRDVFTQMIYGARLSLQVGLLATFIGVGLGLVVGLLAGYLGKIVDETLMRFTDMMLVVPSLPLLIVLAAVLGSSLFNIIIILGFLGWMGFARVVRSQVLSLRERPFIEAAKASGAGTGYTLVRHVFPNVVSLTYVNLALSVPGAIVAEAALSFLGLGDQSLVTWGQMLALARESGGGGGVLHWWYVLPPGLAIALISLSFILLGYALDELFNPRLRRRR